MLSGGDNFRALASIWAAGSRSRATRRRKRACGAASAGRAFKAINPFAELKMKINRQGSAPWQGGIKDGKGTISTESGALKAYPYGFASRFEGKPGTNPEELIGAAHGGGFAMALSLILGQSKLTADHLETSAKITLEQIEGGYIITAIQLTLKAKIPGADQATFEKLANTAEAKCPVSKVLKTNITLDATLLS
jgi:osmotically inducible protein OsmC